MFMLFFICKLMRGAWPPEHADVKKKIPGFTITFVALRQTEYTIRFYNENLATKMNKTHSVVFAFLLTACAQPQPAAEKVDEGATREVLEHHWDAFKANDLEETMKDYTEESVLVTPNATYSGLAEIRTNFVNAFKGFPRDSTQFTLNKSVVAKDIGYILWKAKTPAFNLTYATDTFIIRDGKIVRQTFAGVFE